jgi:C-terminal processing protease CtpA/Prc
MSRIITITHEKDLKYLGFSVKKRKTGPHIIAAVEKDSPAGKAGLKVNDLLLRLNSVNLIGKSYLKTVDLLKKETIAGGSFQLEVIESDLCPLKIRNRSLSTNSLDIDKAEQHINYGWY